MFVTSRLVCTSMSEENVVCVWPDDQHSPPQCWYNCQLTWCHNIEYRSMNFHHCENLKFQQVNAVSILLFKICCNTCCYKTVSKP